MMGQMIVLMLLNSFSHIYFSASHLIKHTGYGNAAGLLMSRGLLGGIGGGESSKGQDGYSSSEDSDTEEYIRSKAR